MVNAVISEFNPFHNGHKYLLETARERTGAEYTVCFMSGNFVQRGDAAVCDKHTRAAMAVRHGADVVFQIPTAHSLSGASVFARSGVFMASSLGVPTTLCFGSEAEDISPLYRLAKVDRMKLAREFKAALSTGKSYASAVMQAYAECGETDASALSGPNNLLAFEYIKAALSLKSNIKTLNIKRVGTDHDSLETDGIFASASYIRDNPDADLTRFLPEPVDMTLDREKLDMLTLFSIYSKTPAELVRYADMCEGLENRFCTAARYATNCEELFDAVKSKRYTYSKLRRAAMSVLVGNPAGLYATDPPYLKVLAFNTKGRELLKIIGDTASLPVITKPADAGLVAGAKAHFELECRASDIYDYCLKVRHGKGMEYRMSPIYVKGENK